MRNLADAIRRTLTFVLLTFAATATAGAQGPGNVPAKQAVAATGPAAAFAGTWEMDAAKSEFSLLESPSKFTLTIQPSGLRVELTETRTTAHGAHTDTLEFPLNEIPTEETSSGETRTWYGRVDKSEMVLIFNTETRDYGDREYRRFSLSADGRELRLHRESNDSFGGDVSNLMFVKQ